MYVLTIILTLAGIAFLRGLFVNLADGRGGVAVASFTLAALFFSAAYATV